jgi:hypothetical protein
MMVLRSGRGRSERGEEDKYIIRLLQIRARYAKKVEQLLEVGITLDEEFGAFEDDLLHLALDMLGVPADNSLEWEPADGDKQAIVPDSLFCRDWFTDTFYDTVAEGTALECEAYIQSARDMMKKGYTQWPATKKDGKKGVLLRWQTKRTRASVRVKPADVLPRKIVSIVVKSARMRPKYR